MKLTTEQAALLSNGDIHHALDVLLYACVAAWEQEMPAEILPHEAKFKEAALRAQFVVAAEMKGIIYATDLPESRVTDLLAVLLAVSAPGFRNSMTAMGREMPRV